jgi:hypothetical protein
MRTIPEVWVGHRRLHETLPSCYFVPLPPHAKTRLNSVQRDSTTCGLENPPVDRPERLQRLARRRHRFSLQVRSEGKTHQRQRLAVGFVVTAHDCWLITRASALATTYPWAPALAGYSGYSESATSMPMHLSDTAPTTAQCVGVYGVCEFV